MSSRHDRFPPQGERLCALAQSFPSLVGAPGVVAFAFDVRSLEEWGMGPPTSPMAAHAVSFIMSVVRGLDVARGKEPPRSSWVGPFDAVQAIIAWDEPHRRAFRQWCESPWCP